MIPLSILVLLSAFFSLSTIALLQRKEYRLDRLLVYFSEAFEWSDFFFRRPLWTLKTILFFTLTLIIVMATGLSFAGVTKPMLLLISLGLACFLVLGQSLIKRISIFLAMVKRNQQSSLLVIGVTGSYGKTGIKEMIATVLSEKLNVLKTPGHVNTDFGIAQVLLRHLRPEHEVCVVEMGAYKKGEIASICRMVVPNIGVLTGINEQHLALFGSMENTMEAKGELRDALPLDGVLFFNADDERVTHIAERFTGKKIGFSGKNGNQEAVVVVATHLGLSKAEIKRGVEKRPKELIEKKKGVNGATFLDDSYSSNPTGFSFALDVLAGQKGRKIIVTPGIIELGPARERVHRELGEKITTIGALLIVTHSSFADLFGADRWCQFTDDQSILKFLSQNLTKEDTVLIEGRISVYLKKGLGL